MASGQVSALWREFVSTTKIGSIARGDRCPCKRLLSAKATAGTADVAVARAKGFTSIICKPVFRSVIPLI